MAPAVSAASQSGIRCEYCKCEIPAESFSYHLKTKHKNDPRLGAPQSVLPAKKSESEFQSKKAGDEPAKSRPIIVAKGLDTHLDEMIQCADCRCEVKLRNLQRHARKVHGKFGSIVQPKIERYTLAVVPTAGAEASFSTDDLLRFNQFTVPFTPSTGPKLEFRCANLADILSSAAILSGLKSANEAAHYVVAEFYDGQKAVFSWMELTGGPTNRTAYVAYETESVPTNKILQPFHLVVPGDKTRSRSLPGLKTIRLLEA